ncbi:hypothetical protein CON36_28240 [Bacillus cereus]|uniref:Uncharacterized protein n=1 Tax=Bacillus cereus TaxID=1396 RepID=A0A9X6SUB1_BACCE|nr:hypothetical protein [Bacillus cereus]PDZ95444.1 hypothetical protein CON36_28240 [Bacillus cereus]
MKPIFLEIAIRMEDWLNKKISTTDYSHYTVMVCEKDEMYPLLEKGLIYDVITFENKNTTIDKYSEEFWNIIKQLEQKRTITSRYERMIKMIKNTYPELLEEELHIVALGGINDYLIYLAVIVVLLTLALSPTYQNMLFNWLHHFI